MRFRAMVLMLVVALAAAGCGTKKVKPASSGKTTTTAKKNKQFKAPSRPQPASASKKPGKKTFAALPKPKKAHQANSARLKGVEGLTIEQKLTKFAGDTGSFWQDAFTRSNLQFTPATVNIIDSPVTTGCGTTIPPDYKYATDYCSADHSVNLPVQTLNTIDQDPKFGDPVVAGDVAVSFGFHVLTLTGVNKSGVDQAALLDSALCLSGIYMSTLQNRFDPGDIDKLAAGFPDSTGSSVNAFVVGFKTVNYSKCIHPDGTPGVNP
jgi:putative neutral zinc metallopeptidase